MNDISLDTDAPGARWHRRLAAWLWAVPAALQFLTRIPVRGIPDWTYDDPYARSCALACYPLVGVVVGIVGATALIAARKLAIAPLAAAVVAVVAGAAITGAFHEDGLADTADGLGPHNREDALLAMRDSRIGSFGSIALWAILTLKAAAMALLPEGKIISVVIAAHVMARWAPLPLAAWLPNARQEPGLGARVASAAGPGVVLVGFMFALAIVGPILGRQSLAPILATVALVAVLGVLFRIKFGGITGDCLGAANQIVETAVLLTMTHGLSR